MSHHLLSLCVYAGIVYRPRASDMSACFTLNQMINQTRHHAIQMAIQIGPNTHTEPQWPGVPTPMTVRPQAMELRNVRLPGAVAGVY